MSIIENKARIGNFTSSEIYRLMGSPAVQKTYIEERNIERRMGVSLETETNTNDMAWGKFLEQRVFDLLEIDYKLSSSETDTHPSIQYWSGSKDLIIDGVKISEIKCYQRKKFALYTDALLTKNIEVIKKDFPKEYWQMVSNSIINGVPKAEAITYMPYRSELPILREMATNYDGEDQWKYRFIAEKEDIWLSFLPDKSYYKNLNLFEFEVPEADKKLLTERVLEAGKLLQPEFIHPSFIEQAKELLSNNGVDYPAIIEKGKQLRKKVGV